MMLSKSFCEIQFKLNWVESGKVYFRSWESSTVQFGTSCQSIPLNELTQRKLYSNWWHTERFEFTVYKLRLSKMLDISLLAYANTVITNKYVFWQLHMNLNMNLLVYVLVNTSTVLNTSIICEGNKTWTKWKQDFEKKMHNNSEVNCVQKHNSCRKYKMIYLLTGMVRLKDSPVETVCKKWIFTIFVWNVVWWSLMWLIWPIYVTDVLLHVFCVLRHMSVLSHGEFYIINN